MVYYNEIDPFAADWLRALISAKVIPNGEVDTRSILEVQAADVLGFAQCHWFAGIGGWAEALRLANWPEDRPIWTGSCPCQSFSAAGKQDGFDDPRHLWPAWFNLIRECRPQCIAGEQVEAAIRHGWLDLVSADLEGEGYAVGAVVLGAHSVGAPHRRQRIYFVADADDAGRQLQPRAESASLLRGAVGAAECVQQPRSDGPGVGVGDTGLTGLGQRGDGDRGDEPGRDDADAAGSTAAAGESRGGLADAVRERGQQESRGASSDEAADGRAGRDGREPDSDHVAGGDGENFWSDLVWLPCRDGKLRPTQPGLFPLAHGVPARVGRLRGYGNAINPYCAAEVLRAYLDREGALIR